MAGPLQAVVLPYQFSSGSMESLIMTTLFRVVVREEMYSRT